MVMSKQKSEQMVHIQAKFKLKLKLLSYRPFLVIKIVSGSS